MIATIISYPLNEINVSEDVGNSYFSDQVVKNIWVNISDAPTDEYIEITFNGVVTTVLITDECRYTPIDIAFQNRDGGIQIITFFKQKRDSITVTNETFESDRNPFEHQFIRYNVNSRSKFVANTGFIDESKNDMIKQLLLSERVWIAGSDIPVNVSQSSLEYKTRANDRLINYAIEFEYAFNDINTI